MVDGDAPADSCEADGLNFVHRYAIPLARRISSPQAGQALTIGIYGSWGSGKTSLMNMVRRLVNEEDIVPGFKPEKKCLTVNFTAWKYDEEDSLWRALVRTVLEQILHEDRSGMLDDKLRKEINIIRQRLYGPVKETQRKLRIDWARLAGALFSLGSVGSAIFARSADISLDVPVQALLASTTVAGLSLTVLGKTLLGIKDRSSETSVGEALHEAGADIIGAFKVVEEVLFTHQCIEFIEQFTEQFQKIVDRYIPGKTLVVFIDDLDRCMPEKAVRVLEGLKLFLGVKNTIFVLGVDVPVLARGIEIHYAAQGYRGIGTDKETEPFINGIRYLEKVVQLPFHIPTIDVREMNRSEMIKDLRSDDDADWLEIGIRGFNANPRAVKRFAQIYRHRAEVIHATDPEVLTGKERHLAKLLVLQEHHRWNALIDVIVKYTDPRLGSMLDGPLPLLERVANDPEQRDELLSGGEAAAAIAQFAYDRDLLKFISSPPAFGGEDPVNPLPLIHLGGGRLGETDVPSEALSLTEIIRDLSGPDPLVRSRAQANFLELDHISRRGVFKRIFEQFNQWTETATPDATGMPYAVASLQKLQTLDIVPELEQILRERKATLARTVERLGSKGIGGKQSSKGLVDLLATVDGDNEAAIEGRDLTVDIPGYVSDTPVSSQDDVLGFRGYAVALAKVIDEATLPFHVGVFGRWGSGKSSFLSILREELMKKPGTHSAWFNPFQYGDVQSIEWMSKGLAEAVPGMDKVLRRLDGVADNAPETMLQRMTALRENVEHHLTSVLASGGRLAVFIDDLDRCTPERNIDTLQTLQSLLRVKGVVAVVAADRQILESAVGAYYKERSDLRSDAFLDRIFDLSFEIPEQTTEATVSMTRALLSETQDDLAAAVSDLSRFLEPNPRAVKRFVNTLRLRQALAEQRDIPELTPQLLAQLLLVENRWPAMFDRLEVFYDLWVAISTGDRDRSDELLQKLEKEGRVLDLDELVAFMEQQPPPDRNAILNSQQFVGKEPQKR